MNKFLKNANLGRGNVGGKKLISNGEADVSERLKSELCVEGHCLEKLAWKNGFACGMKSMRKGWIGGVREQMGKEPGVNQKGIGQGFHL